jgi:hypothetical protein
LARGIGEGQVDIFRHMEKGQIEEIKGVLEKYGGDIAEIRQTYPDQYDYGSLKMVIAYLELKERLGT